MLNLSRESKVALHFSSVRSRVKAVFNSNLTTWEKDFGGVLHSLWWIYLLRQALPLIICKGHRTPEKIFLRWNNEIVVEKAIHHHRADQNPHQRWPNPQRESALHHPPDRGCDWLFSRASGAAALDAVCTHSAELGFCHEFEPDLSGVCHFICSSWAEYAILYAQAG